MADYVINIEGGFTTSIFYNYVLKESHNALVGDKDARLIFDFKKTQYIDALVVPNLLCMGYILKKYNNRVPVIYTLDCGIYAANSNILEYLQQVNFIYYCEKYNLFEIVGIGNWEKKILPEYCTTYYFDDESIKDSVNENEARQKIMRVITSKSKELFEKYLYDYFNEDDVFGYGNIFAKIGSELCHNSIVRGDSFSFMTIQSNLSQQKVYVTVSDVGIGYYNSLISKGEKSTITGYNLISGNPKERSLHSIIECAFTRYFEKEYGIWNIVQIVLSVGGLVRIHSSDSRIVLTNNSFPFIKDVIKNKDELSKFLTTKFLKEKNYLYNSGLKYQGVHIEIEMPIIPSQRRRLY